MSISEAEQRKLFARSGNRCAFYDSVHYCRRLLTADGSPPDRLVVLGEAAHIVAERPGGPRGNSPLPLADRNRAENLVLLCNNHHQLIDSQPNAYTVERLLAMKEAHEQWVEKRLGLGRDAEGDAAPPACVPEVVHSTLLPVEHMPVYLYGAPCSLDERDVPPKLGPLRAGEMAPFVVRGKTLYTFQDLAERGNPFEPIVAGQPVNRFGIDEWCADPDHFGWFIQLLNRALNKLTGRRGLQFDREHRRYYFAPPGPSQSLSVTYRPLNKARATRSVVWQPKRKSTGETQPYWLHRAVALRFLQSRARSWVLSIRPELRVTTDGVTPLPSETIGGRVTRKKSRTFNYDLLGEVHFWSDYLSKSQPRITLPFGNARQTIVISTTLMRGDVKWPGIPKEHAKPFKNVEYVDDLFSWAEFRSIEEGIEKPDEDEWREEEAEDDDDES